MLQFFKDVKEINKKLFLFYFLFFSISMIIFQSATKDLQYYFSQFTWLLIIKWGIFAIVLTGILLYYDNRREVKKILNKNIFLSILSIIILGCILFLFGYSIGFFIRNDLFFDITFLEFYQFFSVGVVVGLVMSIFANKKEKKETINYVYLLLIMVTSEIILVLIGYGIQHLFFI
ncbi:MAG: hypothetical protein U9N76_07000 [Candidatus Marinimicrobia bacterium]|nr:hypothetical protein [Candidatus Neomarinimicrobiota bacterium]